MKGAVERLETRWRWWVLLFWLGTCAFLLWSRWGPIDAFALGDTDDNMRIMQVRALIAGQGWFDLRQHRLNPPFGADIHWSRLVDLPIAGIKLALAPFVGGPTAEKAAVALAPLLPMAAAMAAVAVVARRLIAPWAFPLAIAILLCGHSVRNQWAPLRIDHHGWQLALLAVAAAALTDPKRARGGAVLGIATALSLVIGLEMLLYLALLGGIAVLLWVRDPAEGRRLATYGASLAGGAALGFLVFASYANRAPVCDALSPVWLSVVVAGGAIAVGLTLLAPRFGIDRLSGGKDRAVSVDRAEARQPAGKAADDGLSKPGHGIVAEGRTEGGRWPLRLALAAAGGAALAAGFVLAWPNCLGRLEGASPELVRLWLGNVREARPLYMHGYSTAISVAALPAAGLIGYAIMLWKHRGDPPKLAAWASTAAPALLAALLLLWQSRAGPAAQLLAVPGATALVWLTVTSRFMAVRVVGTVALFLLASGLLPQQMLRYFPPKPRPGMAVVNKANSQCPTLGALKPVAQVPRGQVLTFVDLGPRLIALTHHDAVAGPYHRNGPDILDVMHAFRGSADSARAIIERRRIDYVLICPNLSESTVYSSQARNGFYAQLAGGRVPAWLRPVPLPAKSPYRMWRVVRSGASAESSPSS